ncbi:MAG: hypothetical protein RI946_1680 [Pseudomonadota bacterium]
MSEVFMNTHHDTAVGRHWNYMNRLVDARLHFGDTRAHLETGAGIDPLCQTHLEKIVCMLGKFMDEERLI